MKKLVLDADALIKLVKSGIINHMKQEIYISTEVYDETVTVGKKKLYSDAFEIEQLVKSRKILLRKSHAVVHIDGLGKGESSSFALFNKIQADAIISDDKRFLSFLEEQRAPFLIPTECIVGLFDAKIITVEESRNALKQLQQLVAKENYDSAISALGGKQ